MKHDSSGCYIVFTSLQSELQTLFTLYEMFTMSFLGHCLSPSLISSLFPQWKLWLSCNGLTIHELNRICFKKTMHDTHTTSQLWLCKPNRQLLVVNSHTHRPEQSSNGYPLSISLYVSSGPVPVLVMSLLFIASVFMLHIWGKYTRS